MGIPGTLHRLVKSDFSWDALIWASLRLHFFAGKLAKSYNNSALGGGEIPGSGNGYFEQALSICQFGFPMRHLFIVESGMVAANR